MLTKLRLILIGIALILTCSVGAVSTYLVMRPKTQIVSAEKQQTLKDGSVELATVPVAALTTAAILPAGSKLVSHSSLTLTRETTASNLKDSGQTLTPLPPIPMVIDDIKEANGNDRIVVKAPGYEINGSEQVLSTEVVASEVPKHEITGLYGYDTFQHKQIYGIEYKQQLTQHISVTGLVIGRDIAGGIGVSW